MHLHPYILLTSTAIFFSFNFIIGKVLAGIVPPITLGLIRWIIPFTLFVALTRNDIKNNLHNYLPHWPLFLFLGATGYSINNIAVYKSVLHTTAVNASFISSFNPIIFALLAFILYKERLIPIQLMGIFISIIGVFYILFQGDLGLILGLKINPGDGFMLISTGCWAIHSLVVKRKCPGIAWMPLFTILIFAGMLVTLPLALYENIQGGLGWVSSLNSQHLFAIIALSLLPSLVGYISWNLAIIKVPSCQAAVFLNLIPVFTSILSIIILGETVLVSHVIGGALIVSGVILVTHGHLLFKNLLKKEVAKAT